HGDYHLQQVLFTGRDFAIIDFEGERARPLSERRIKRSALRDVATMLRSFHYAAFAVLFGQMPGIIESPEKRPILEAWARFWHAWVSRAFLEGYLTTAGNAPFLPASREELQLLLNAYTLEKAIDELGFELNDRPDWVRIPLLGILEMLERR
ncbi:MAG: alpha-amylase, partial [Bryobacteraceae bacterium]|nr:alpha-amylase [Bryobacteraceae bacterium]